MAARTIDYWYQLIIAQKNATTELNDLDSTSKTADFVLWAFIVATAIAALDNLWDVFLTTINVLLAAKKPHRLTWYRQMALNFQYGQTPIADTDQYANTGLSDTQIAAQKIIAQAAATRVFVGLRLQLRLKVVKSVGGVYTKLNTAEMAAFSAYVFDQSDAGVDVIPYSFDPDNLKLGLDIWYDPLVLLPNGSRIDGTSATPVPDAINAYLKNLEFNGQYSNLALVEALRAVDGVVIPVVKVSQSQYGAFAFVDIDEIYIPDAGYLYLNPVNLALNFRQYVQY